MIILEVLCSYKVAHNGQIFAMAGQESSFSDNKSSILFQKPNIRTDVQ